MLEEISKETFDKFYSKYSKEKEEMEEALGKLTPQISNLKKSIEEAVAFSNKLSTVWACSPVRTKEKLQKLLFPEGILYSKEKEAFRTETVNSFFLLIACAAKFSAEHKKGTNEILPPLSLVAEREGFEPPEVFTLNDFQDRRNRPLQHLF